MIPAAFDYTAPESLQDAIAALVDGGEDAKLIAGGHSLIPLMKLRLAAPSLLVDLRKVPGLHGVERQNGHWRVGALTTHTVLEQTPDLGVVSAVAATIAAACASASVGVVRPVQTDQTLSTSGRAWAMAASRSSSSSSSVTCLRYPASTTSTRRRSLAPSA